ncbi:MAG: transporter [Gordonia sp. (in: high G+C Gram-positive bacteria)]|uniref:PH-like domain-containing protein n=1 Tax=Gordonia TaxID=2053 RepID=UPI003266CB19
MNNFVYYTLIAVVALIVWLTLVAMVLRGWRNRGRRQEEAVGEFPAVPADLGEPVRGPHTGLYLGSTLAPSWQNRIAVGDYGDRATAELTAYPAGLLLSRHGATDIWIPEESIVAVRTERGIAGKAMSRDGVLVIRWTLPTGTQLDSGLRADDKTVYPAWVAAYAEITEKAYRELDLADERESGTEKKDKR